MQPPYPIPEAPPSNSVPDNPGLYLLWMEVVPSGSLARR